MAAKKPSTLLAWVGSLTAVFSLIAGVYAGWSFLSGQLEKRRNLDHLLAEEAVQQSASDYESAWKTLAQADTVDPGSARVHQAQEDVAMQWLDNIEISGDQTFTSIVEKLDPVLTRGVAATKSPQRQADLLAHLGWSYFLRRRESVAGPDPEGAYRRALEEDPANPYAHAMWGHWILWNHQSFAQASEQFAAALASPRPDLRAYVRSLQLSALTDVHTPEASQEMIRVANNIRQEHGDVDAHMRGDILFVYQECMYPPNQSTAGFLSAVPAPDHLATFDWLVQQAGREDPDSLVHAYIHAALLEAAGRSTEALASYRSLQARFGPEISPTLANLTRKAIIRLSNTKQARQARSPERLA